MSLQLESFRNVYLLNIFSLYILFIIYIKHLGVSVIPPLNRNHIFPEMHNMYYGYPSHNI